MESMEPTKAPRIMAMELKRTPRLRKNTIIRDTVSLAPEEMPSTKGPAMGLAKKVWSRKPDTLSAPPRMAAASRRGSRMPQMIPSSGGLIRVSRISRGVKSTLPAFRFQSSRTSSRTIRKTKQKQYRIRVFLIAFLRQASRCR